MFSTIGDMLAFELASTVGAVLAVDTTVRGCCSVALLDGVGREFCVERYNSGRYADDILIMVDELFSKSGCSYKGLGCIVTVCGPGSFTGIRVGVSYVRTVSMIVGIPAFGVSSLEVGAYEVASDLDFDIDNGHIRSIVSAGKGKFYTQLFDDVGVAFTEPELVELSKIDSDISCVWNLKSFGALSVARLAVDKLSRGDKMLPVEPLYCQDFHVIKR